MMHPRQQSRSSAPPPVCRPAVFLDRDGVINRDSPDYIKSWSEFEFLLVLPETSVASAGTLRDKVAEQLALLPEFTATDVDCQAAFSTAEWHKGDTALDLVARAAEAAAELVS